MDEARRMAYEHTPLVPHLDTGSIVDLARGLGGGAEQAHVAACASCRARIGLWTQMAVAARADRGQTPPEARIRRALELSRPARPAAGALRLLARAWAQAAVPAGVRGAEAHWPVVYEAEGVAVDVHVQDVGARTVIVGQIAESAEPGRLLSDVPVLLLDGEQVAVRGLSNAWGEFHLEHRATDELRLEVALAGERTLEVPLRPPRRTGTP
jgi:hypothetical protein